MLYCAYCDYVTPDRTYPREMPESDLLMNHATDRHLEEALAAEKAADDLDTTGQGHWHSMIRRLTRSAWEVRNGVTVRMAVLDYS